MAMGVSEVAAVVESVVAGKAGPATTDIRGDVIRDGQVVHDNELSGRSPGQMPPLRASARATVRNPQLEQGDWVMRDSTGMKRIITQPLGDGSSQDYDSLTDTWTTR